MTVNEAYDLCTKQALGHYENFPVGSMWLPKEKRRHIHAVYAFARTADDFADETVKTLSVRDRLALLDRWEKNLDDAVKGNTKEPVFIALKQAIDSCRLPVQLLKDLLDAFRQDVKKTRYQNFDEVLHYCKRSANPVGRLVLHIFDYRDERLHVLSDYICTGLQLANFWQDVSVDIDKDRIYLPQDEMDAGRVTEAQLAARKFSGSYRQLLMNQVNRTQAIFNRGYELPSHLDHGLRLEIKMTWLGGVEILRKIEALDYNTLQTRPKISKWDFILMGAKALCMRW